MYTHISIYTMELHEAFGSGHGRRLAEEEPPEVVASPGRGIPGLRDPRPLEPRDLGLL